MGQLREFTDADKDISSVETRLAEYESLDSELFQKVSELIKAKSSSWDISVPGSNAPVTQMLIFEYLYGVREIARNQATETPALSALEAVDEQEMMKSVYDKLAGTLETFRLGGLKPEDGEIPYGKSLDDKTAITCGSNEYEINSRQRGTGAQKLNYIKDGKLKNAIVLFEKDKPSIVGRSLPLGVTSLEGTDFSNVDLMEIRQVVFHELNHVMENCIVKGDEIPQTVQMNGSEYENYYEITSYITMEDGKARVYSLDQPIKIAEGIATEERREGGKKKHNQITEGAVEYSSRKIMSALGIPEKYIDKGKYGKNVIMFEEATKEYGCNRTVANFLTHSYEVKKALESMRTTDDRTLLAEMNAFVENEQRTYTKDGQMHYIGKDLEDLAQRAMQNGSATAEQIKRLRYHDFWKLDRDDEGYDDKFQDILAMVREIDTAGGFEEILTESRKNGIREKARGVVAKYKAPRELSTQGIVTGALKGKNKPTQFTIHEVENAENVRGEQSNDTRIFH